MLTPVIDPSELGDHLAQRLRLPARPVVAAVVGLQRVDEIGEQWQQVQRARRARGLGLDGGVWRRLEGSARSAFALLVLTMRQTGATSLAMDARGFAAARAGRTWARGAPWLIGDSVVLARGLGDRRLPLAPKMTRDPSTISMPSGTSSAAVRRADAPLVLRTGTRRGSGQRLQRLT